MEVDEHLVTNYEKQCDAVDWILFDHGVDERMALVKEGKNNPAS